MAAFMADRQMPRSFMRFFACSLMMAYLLRSLFPWRKDELLFLLKIFLRQTVNLPSLLVCFSSKGGLFVFVVFISTKRKPNYRFSKIDRFVPPVLYKSFDFPTDLLGDLPLLLLETPMSPHEYTYGELRSLFDKGALEELFKWVCEIGHEKGIEQKWTAEWIKYNSNEKDHDAPAKALSDIADWFLGKETEDKCEGFWKQAFGKTTNLEQLEKKIHWKVREIFRSTYLSGGMHKNESSRLVRMCREQMQADDKCFRRESFKERDYYGLLSWPGIGEKPTLMVGEPPDLPKRNYVRANVVDGGKRTSPFRDEDVREACQKALQHLDAYCLVVQLKEALVKNGWFVVHRSLMVDVAKRERDCSENAKVDFALEDFEKNLLRFFKNLGPEIRTVLKERTFPRILGGEEDQVLTFEQLAEKHDHCLQTWKNREKKALESLRGFFEAELMGVTGSKKATQEDVDSGKASVDEHLTNLRFFIDFFENGNLGTLLAIDETNNGRNQSP